jgi:hypothetical protein
MAPTVKRYIYRPSIRLRNGRRIFAAQYGLKAFKIPVRDDYEPSQPRLPGL